LLELPLLGNSSSNLLKFIRENEDLCLFSFQAPVAPPAQCVNMAFADCRRILDIDCQLRYHGFSWEAVCQKSRLQNLTQPGMADERVHQIIFV